MHLLIFDFESCRKQSALIFWIRCNLTEIRAFCQFVTYVSMKIQNGHKTTIFTENLSENIFTVSTLLIRIYSYVLQICIDRSMQGYVHLCRATSIYSWLVLALSIGDKGCGHWVVTATSPFGLSV